MSRGGSLTVSLSIACALGGCSQAVGSSARGFDEFPDAAPLGPQTTTLVINEVAAAGSPDDWFEIYNGTAETIDLAGYKFFDTIAGPDDAAGFPEGAAIRPGEYYVVFLTDDDPGFGLGGDEELALFTLDGTIVDAVDWEVGDSPEDASYARLPDAIGEFATTVTPTRGYPNEIGPPS